MTSKSGMSGKSGLSGKDRGSPSEYIEREEPGETNYNVSKNRKIGIEVELMQSSAA